MEKRAKRTTDQVLRDKAEKALIRFSTKNTQNHYSEQVLMWKGFIDRLKRGCPVLSIVRKWKPLIVVSLVGTNPIRNCEELEASGITNYIIHAPELNEYVIDKGNNQLKNSKYKDKVVYHHMDLATCVTQLIKQGISVHSILWDGTCSLKNYIKKDKLYEKLVDFIYLKREIKSKSFIFEVLLSTRLLSKADVLEQNYMFTKSIYNLTKLCGYQTRYTHTAQYRDNGAPMCIVSFVLTTAPPSRRLTILNKQEVLNIIKKEEIIK